MWRQPELVTVVVVGIIFLLAMMFLEDEGACGTALAVVVQSSAACDEDCISNALDSMGIANYAVFKSSDGSGSDKYLIVVRPSSKALKALSQVNVAAELAKNGVIVSSVELMTVCE